MINTEIRIVLFSFLFLASLFLFLELRVLLGFFVAKSKKGSSLFYTKRKWSRIVGIVCGIIAVISLIDSFLIEPDWVIKEQLSVVSHKVKKPIKIAQISDIHMDNYCRRHDKAIEIINQNEPDIIVLTGDYLNGIDSQYSTNLRKFISQLKAPLGVYAVGGNFDFNKAAFKIFEENGIHYLNNEAAVFEESGLVLCGLDCVWELSENEQRFINEMFKNNSDKFLILLVHYPNHIEEPEVQNMDLYLCGHTHGGQVRLPIWGAIITLSALGKKYECGKYLCNNMHIYVNRGLGMEGGTVPRVRFLCRPEVTIIDIVPKE
ncbi:MAG: metallophosphoesterase [Planctomycetota bacterium]